MEPYATQKKNVEQISVFVLPQEKELVKEKAKAEERSVSNYCKRKILGGVTTK